MSRRGLTLRAIGERLRLAASSGPYTVHAGIDEAGLGPVLGPLSIGMSVLRMPEPESDPWKLLKGIVSVRPNSDKRRIVVTDSKQVFTRTPRGERRLETTALTFLAQLDEQGLPPVGAREVLAHEASGAEPRWLENEAWCAHLARELPRFVDPGALELLAARLGRELAQNGVELLAAGTHQVPVTELNASFRTTDNKSRTHWDSCAPILSRLWEQHAAEGLWTVVDRHGGRMRYGRLLSETLPEVTVDVLREESSYSEYSVRSAAGGRMRIVFLEKAERFSFPVALASCLAKYTREACMQAFNEYFETLQPGLKPTAGYLQDGRRWLDEARPAIERSGCALEQLVRQR